MPVWPSHFGWDLDAGAKGSVYCHRIWLWLLRYPRPLYCISSAITFRLAISFLPAITAAMTLVTPFTLYVQHNSDAALLPSPVVPSATCSSCADLDTCSTMCSITLAPQMLLCCLPFIGVGPSHWHLRILHLCTFHNLKTWSIVMAPPLLKWTELLNPCPTPFHWDNPLFHLFKIFISHLLGWRNII